MNYNFNYTKTYNDGLEEFMSKVEFIKNFNSEPEVNINTNTAYYKLDELLNDIENFFSGKDIKKKKSYKYYDYNKSKLISEIVFINITDRYCISLIVTGIDNINESNEDEDEEWQEVINQEVQNIKNNEIGIFFNGLSFLENESKLQSFFDLILEKGLPKRKKTLRELNIIAKGEYGLYLQPFDTDKKHVDIESNYNDDFNEINLTVVENLNKKEKNGIVLFSGDPGTGKTTYIRHLIQQVSEKKLIYVTPDMSTVLGEPDFVTFMIKNKHSILIIEDGENILKKRGGGGNAAISNLLNISDGLLGDALKLQIICTFNCKYSDIDEALTRPGRLIAEYKFGKLSLEKTNKLLAKIHKGKNYISKEPLTLAEIYTFDNKPIKSKEEHKIGFLK